MPVKSYIIINRWVDIATVIVLPIYKTKESKAKCHIVSYPVSILPLFSKGTEITIIKHNTFKKNCES